MNTALEYSTRVVQEGGSRCKKSTLNDLVHLTPLRIPLMNPPFGSYPQSTYRGRREIGAVYLPSQLECTLCATTLLVMVNRVKGGGRATPTLTRLS
jgi:hypothetical protein